MTQKFKKKNERIRMQQTFDKDSITMKRAGQEVNVYDFIQANREDTELYEVLEKYGCIDKIKKTDEALYADITEIQKLDGLRGMVEKQKQAKMMFEQLPIEVRKEFNNSLNEFSIKAPQYLQKLGETLEMKNELKLEMEKGEEINVKE